MSASALIPYARLGDRVFMMRFVKEVMNDVAQTLDVASGCSLRVWSRTPVLSMT